MLQVLTIAGVIKDIKRKENFADNHDHNILRLLDVLSSFPFTPKETNTIIITRIIIITFNGLVLIKV